MHILHNAGCKYNILFVQRCVLYILERTICHPWSMMLFSWRLAIVHDVLLPVARLRNVRDHSLQDCPVRLLQITSNCVQKPFTPRLPCPLPLGFLQIRAVPAIRMVLDSDSVVVKRQK